MVLMKRLLWVFPAALIVPMLSGCASLAAKGKALELPPMNVPPAPPRVIEPAPEPLPEPVAELPPAPVNSPVARSNARPPVSRPSSQAEAAKPDPKPVDPPPTAPQDPAPVQPPPPVPPAAQLRTPQTADTSNAEKNIRATVDRARGLLQNVDYRILNSERKKAYNDSGQFMRQAEEALKQGNLEFALAVANKAETLAKELAGK